jgi:hypothetical protein
MPREQMMIDQIKRSQLVIDEYQKTSESFRNTLESIIDNQRLLIDDLKLKCELFEQFLKKDIKV